MGPRSELSAQPQTRADKMGTTRRAAQPAGAKATGPMTGWSGRTEVVMRGLFGRLAARLRPSIFKGQKGQDRWVLMEVLRWQRGGFFLDLAAADGVTDSNTHVLERWFGWAGICIEPNPAFFAQLKA